MAIKGIKGIKGLPFARLMPKLPAGSNPRHNKTNFHIKL